MKKTTTINATVNNATVKANKKEEGKTMKKTTKKAMQEKTINVTFKKVSDIPNGKIQFTACKDIEKFVNFYDAVTNIAVECDNTENKLKRWKNAFAEDIETLKTIDDMGKVADLQAKIAKSEKMIEKHSADLRKKTEKLLAGKADLESYVTKELHNAYKVYIQCQNDDLHKLYVLKLANTLDTMGIPAGIKGINYIMRQFGVLSASNKDIMRTNGVLVKAMNFKQYRELMCRVLSQLVVEKCPNATKFDKYNKRVENEKKQAENAKKAKKADK